MVLLLNEIRFRGRSHLTSRLACLWLVDWNLVCRTTVWQVWLAYYLQQGCQEQPQICDIFFASVLFALYTIIFDLHLLSRYKNATLTVTLESGRALYVIIHSRSHFDSRNYVKATNDQNGSTRELHPRKPTWQCRNNHLKMHLLLENGEFPLSCHRTLPETYPFCT